MAKRQNLNIDIYFFLVAFQFHLGKDLPPLVHFKGTWGSLTFNYFFLLLSLGKGFEPHPRVHFKET